MDDEMDSYSQMTGHGYAPSSGFPENSYTELDDSDQVYHETYEELEEKLARTRKWVAEYKSRTEELVGK